MRSSRSDSHEGERRSPGAHPEFASHASRSSQPYTNQPPDWSLARDHQVMRGGEFEQLYEAHAASLLAFLEYRTGNVELARDIHADTFERVLKARWRFDPRKGSQKTWLYTVALNCLRDHARRRAAEGRALEKLAAGTRTAHWDEEETVDTRDALLRGMATLSDEEREAIALRYGADLSLREIAAVTGTRTTTVKGRLHRGLQGLREK